MLEARSMRVLHDSLRPPDGYELDCVVGTTFTLDLVSLLSIPLAVGRFSSDEDGAAATDPLALLASLERSTDRITVFHQAGAIRVPERHRELLTLVEGSLFSVALRTGSLFHPKMWVARYRDPASAVHHRIVVLSRNLTPDRSWDTLVVLEGDGGRSAASDSRPVSDFVTWLARRSGLTGDRRRTIDDLARSVGRTRFRPPAPFDAVRFRPLGIRGYTTSPIVNARRDRIFVMSPFIGDDELHRLTAGTSGSLLVTRAEELARLQDPSATGFESILQLSEGLEPEPEEGAVILSIAVLVGLHAKLYCVDQGWRATIWTGSANATRAGFSSNVEFLVELEGRKGVCGVDALLGGDAPGSLSTMLCPIEDVPKRAPDDETERRLDELAARIATLPVEVVSQRVESGRRLELHLDEPVDLPEGVTVRVTPVASTAAPTELDLARSPIAAIDGLADHEVSGLFVVEAALVEPRAKRSFVARWPLSGDIPDRVRALLARLVTDRERLMAFLRLLLGSGDGWEPSATVNGTTRTGGDSWLATLGSGTPPFELLVRAVASHPERLDALARWIPELAAAAGGETEAELLAIWQPIWQARLEQQQ